MDHPSQKYCMMLPFFVFEFLSLEINVCYDFSIIGVVQQMAKRMIDQDLT